MKILLADDDTTFRLVLTAKLQKLGHEVVAVVDGLEAWDAFQKEYFPILITDWIMPRLNGLVLSTLVRAKPHDKYTYVIMVASRGGKENFLEAMQAGVDDFITKPPDDEELAARLLVGQRIVGVQNHVKRLETVMSICSYCKKIRGQDDQWLSLEDYASKQLHFLPSHGLCPVCFAEHVAPDLQRMGIKVDGNVLEKPEGTA